METILRFFSDLILWTAGLAVLILWICIIIGLSVEIYDLIFNRDNDNKENNS